MSDIRLYYQRLSECTSVVARESEPERPVKFSQIWWYSSEVVGTPTVVVSHWSCGEKHPKFEPHHHHNRFTALFRGPPGWAGAQRELLDSMVQGEINRGRHTDHPAGATPSGLTSAHLHLLYEPHWQKLLATPLTVSWSKYLFVLAWSNKNHASNHS